MRRRKKPIRLTEKMLRKIIRSAINESTYEDASNKAFNAAQKFQYPEKTKHLIKRLEKAFGVNFSENVVTIYNRFNEPRYAKCFTYDRTTSSYEDGPEDDFSEEINSILLNCGFQSDYNGGSNDERNYYNFESYHYYLPNATFSPYDFKGMSDDDDDEEWDDPNNDGYYY